MDVDLVLFECVLCVHDSGCIELQSFKLIFDFDIYLSQFFVGSL